MNNRRARERIWQLVADASLVVLLLVVGLAGSVTAYRALALRAADQQRELLSAMGQSIVGAFDLQQVRAIEALQVTAQMLSTQPNLTRDQFRRYGASLLGESSTMTLLEWQPVVPRAQLAAFEQRAAQEQPGYRVVEPAGEDGGFTAPQPRDVYVPVLYSWPESGAALGVDMAFDPRRMRSKLLARDAGAPLASETFALIRRGQIGAQTQGFAVSAPVYRGSRPLGVEARRAALVGYIAGIIEVPELMREASLRANANELDLFVYDRDGMQRLIYSSTGAAATGSDERDTVHSVDVGGRPWHLVLRPRPGFVGAGVDELPLAALGAGVLATLLVGLAVARSLVIRRRLERAEAVLAERTRHLTNVLDGTEAGTWDWYRDAERLNVNERWAQMLGRSKAELEPVSHKTWERLCHAGDLVETLRQLQRHLDGLDERYSAEFRMRHADGHWVWIQSTGRVVERDAEGRATRLAGIHMDISRRKADEQRMHDDARALEAANRQLRDLAIVDALTGAFNRRHFNDVCLAALVGAQRGQAVALCMLDVDYFKAYNDHYGHQAGDVVLQKLAQTLKDGLRRSTDALFRLGGEEFGIVFSATSAESARQFVGQLSAALHVQAMPHEQSPLRIVTASFGLAWWAAPTSHLTPETMYAQADTALYDAKRGGRDQIAIRCFLPGEGEQVEVPDTVR
ncbi:diguanylate cyclase domain-containing protein [Roseateles asaccharophilus]|uniref:diguanylate cyclase n=1 Tax=Roseateles asaccharophilus TaxID=582607 RepID=A0ABU2A697_9BURK|nr:diguanylate cyclase [Roseateles asaccharophilus]MDR7332007.1 diguanylate cyclase (GGDEF)-like protein/PAS domain S-box-containing protein [Roseateles asaccharophilus]